MNLIIKRLKNLLSPQFAPCSVISRKPLIIASFWFDFFHNLNVFENVLPRDVKVTLFAKLGYHYETEKRMLQLRTEYDSMRRLLPNVEVVFFCNSTKEHGNFKAAGLNCRHIHQNVFLDERRYHILPRAKKEFDAVYVARATPCKRHELAAQIPRLLVIGGYMDSEKNYYDFVRRTLVNSEWKAKVSGIFIFRQLNRARTALCLSEIEGAMYVSAEYMLCGLPVVNTPNIGGRDLLLAPEFTKVVEPDPAAVADGVRELKARSIDPFAVRKAILEKMRPFREAYVSLLHETFESAGCDRPFDFKFGNQYCFHKLGLRCPVLPWEKIRRGLKKITRND